ncbi:unnamed protein product [Effrenium voratum]|nr:unnamed protein product [Effrenium voratum]
MVACEQLHIEICSHRGALSQDDSPKLLTSEGLNDLLGAGFRCADLDLTREKESWIIGHPGDLSTLKSLGRDLSEALGFPQLLQTWQHQNRRLLALELKAEPVTATELEELLEQLTAQRLPNGSVGVWYLPQELGLFEQVHRDRYPGLLGIMAMFDRPWRGADVGSKESLDAAARAGIQVRATESVDCQACARAYHRECGRVCLQCGARAYSVRAQACMQCKNPRFVAW